MDKNPRLTLLMTGWWYTYPPVLNMLARQIGSPSQLLGKNPSSHPAMFQSTNQMISVGDDR